MLPLRQTLSPLLAGNDSAALQDSKPAAMVTLADTTDRPKKRRKVEYRTMIDTCTEICNIASKRHDTSEQVYGDLLAMLSILRGNGSLLDTEQSFRELIDNQERAFRGTRGSSRHGVQPVAARAPASGRPKENWLPLQQLNNQFKVAEKKESAASANKRSAM
jgi:hypothetical protein